MLSHLYYFIRALHRQIRTSGLSAHSISPVGTFYTDFDTLAGFMWRGSSSILAFVLFDTTKKLWLRSFLKDYVDKGVPTTRLVIQYHIHKQLCAAANTIVYKGKVALAYQTSNLSSFLSYLLNNLPEFTAGDKKYKVNSFSNFIDVDGKHQTIHVEKGVPTKQSRAQYRMQEIRRMAWTTAKDYVSLSPWNRRSLTMPAIEMAMGASTGYAKGSSSITIETHKSAS